MRRSLLIAFLILCFGSQLHSQLEILFYLKISDDSGGEDSLVFGVNSSATYNVDAALGENSSPPIPAGFSSVFVATRGGNDWGLGLLKKDLRDTTWPSWQIDTFTVQVTDSLAPQANIHLSWPDSAYFFGRADSLVMSVAGDIVDFPSGRLNMSSRNSLDISRPYDPAGWNRRAPQCRVTIIVYGFQYIISCNGVEGSHSTAPSTFLLHRNYPNPFNPSTTIRYSLPSRAFVSIVIYNLLGQPLTTLVSEEQYPGERSIEWTPGSLPSGVYFCRMQAGSFTAVSKLLYLK